MREQLQAILNKYGGFSISTDDAARELRDLANKIKSDIDANPNTKIKDLYP